MKRGILIVVILIIGIAAGFGLYTHSDHYQMMAQHFSGKTTINGVDCSGMTVKEAEKTLTDRWQSRRFTVNREGKEVASFPLSKITYDIEDSLQVKLGTNVFSVLKSHAGGKKEFTVAMEPVEKKKLLETIKKDSFLKIPYKVKTKDAYVNMDNTDFKVVKEVQGDNVDKAKVAKHIVKKISKGTFSLSFKPASFIEKPVIKSDSDVLKKEQEFDKKHYVQKIVFDTFKGKYVVKPKDLAKMMPADGSGGTRLDEKAVGTFVKKVLAWELNTQYAPRKFKSSDQGTITVYGGNYGYAINKKKEKEQLIKELKSGKDVERKPFYSHQPYYKGQGKSDIGNSYIEVSISSQHLWLYQKGKVTLSTDVVTGKRGHDTACGVFQVEFLQTNATLRGDNDDGSRYKTKVNWWMPFNGGQGCHDAYWRGSFGGTQYISGGSHGCVNMPSWAAAQLYTSIEAGYPVVVHY